MIGHSLSFCVIDIALDRVSYTDVEKIISGIYAPTVNHFLQVVDQYKTTYWSYGECDAEKAASIAIQLYDEGKIEQPRLEGKPSPQLVERWTS